MRFTSQVEAAGSWGGVLFRDDPLDQNLSSIAHAKFEYPVFAIQVDSLAGTLFHNKFTDTELGDVYLDRDSRLPFGEEWVLDGGTDVRFEAGADQSGGGEVSDRIEFTVEGTQEPAARHLL